MGRNHDVGGRSWRGNHSRSSPVRIRAARNSTRRRPAGRGTARSDVWTPTGGSDALVQLFDLQLNLGRTYLPELPLLAQHRHNLALQTRRVMLTQELLAAMHNEMEELRDETPWKPWRKPFPMTPEGRDRLVVELVDVLHFLLELALVWGVSPAELYTVYVGKRQHNLRRPEHVHR